MSDLLRYGAEWNFPDDWADEPFQQALADGDLMTVVAYTRHTNIDRKICGDRTPLMHAAASGRDYLVEKLLENNANPDLVDDNGNTAAEIATANHHDDIAEFLLNTVPSIQKNAEN